MDTEDRYANKMYVQGYQDAQANKKPANGDPDYLLGFDDGEGDLELGIVRHEARPVDDAYYYENEAPVGFAWAGFKRRPEPGDWYLSKGGNANLAEKVRGNDQQRHILTPLDYCACYEPDNKAGNKRCPRHHPSRYSFNWTLRRES